jgi:hypothetical protein
MYQALHILKKDFRYLWREIFLFLVLVGLFAWKDYLWVEVLLPVTAAYIIARLIHAEPLPGDAQFWVTRPYHWQSLFTAKLLFILIILDVPVAVARITQLMHAGYLFDEELKPLLWSQLLMIAGFCLPVAAVAAITTEMVSFFFSIIAMLVVGFSVAAIPVARVVVWNEDVSAWPDGVVWVRGSFGLAIVIFTALYILWSQYKTRLTRRTRAVAATLLLVAIVGNFTITPGTAVELHTRFSHRPPFASQVRVDVDAKPRRFAFQKRDRVQISIPLNVTGMPSDLEANIDAMRVRLEGRTQIWEAFTTPSRNSSISKQAFDAFVFVTPSFFASEQGRAIRLSGSLYMTAFGDARSTAVTLTPTPSNIGDGLQCFVNDITSQLHCRSAFRWPALLVYAKVRNDHELLWPIVSYSPFPAGMELNYTEEHQVGGPPPHEPRAHIVRFEPKSHFRTDFVIDQFNVGEFVASR